MERFDPNRFIGEAGVRKIRKGDVIAVAGMESGSCLCLVLSGAVRIVHRKDERALIVGTLGKGQFFGEYSFILGRPLDFDAIAVEPNTIVMYLDKHKFMQEAKSNIALMRELLNQAMVRMGSIQSTMTKLNVPVRAVAGPDMVKLIIENRASNLLIPSMINNTRSAFVAHDRYVFRQGQVNDGMFYLVTEGQLAAHWDTETESGEAMFFMPGDLFGFARPATNATRSYSALAIKDSRIMSFDYDLLIRILGMDAECAWRIFRTIVTQIVMLDEALHNCVDSAAAHTDDEKVERQIFKLLHGDDSVQPSVSLEKTSEPIQ